ncbi:MAG TPA: histidine kinase [Solirubrobacteraceae bacterium]|nr:histidine kinase [Solirubrobacteraceae bacterium]
MIGRRRDRGRHRRAREREARERHALELHDNLVQGLTAIHWALEAEAYDHAKEAARATLAEARGIIGELLGEDPGGSALAPGALRRDAPAAHKP